MVKFTKFLFLIVSFIFVSSCSGGEKKDTSDLYAKSTTRQAIVERSGTQMRAGSDEESKRIQLMDAQNRIRTKGGLFGKEGIKIFSTDEQKNKDVASIGLPINPYLWKASIETISFMPIASADPFAGIIVTDWYSANTPTERCKLNIFINGAELKTDNLKVNSFCQSLSDENLWIDTSNDNDNDIKIENAILNKAKKIKLSTG